MRGREVVKASESCLHHSAVLSQDQWKEIEGLVFVRYYRTEQKCLKKAQRTEKEIVMSDTRCNTSVLPPC